MLRLERERKFLRFLADKHIAYFLQAIHKHSKVSMTPAPLQKLMHGVAYATLTLLWMWTLEKIYSMPLRIALAFTVSVGIGAVLEWYQTSVPGRFGKLTDVMINTVGSIVGLTVAFFLL